ncbi:Cerato-platanin [Apodospora peruviana]|uniref:Cerato-platanin n=1 Tax=Apodospora peruviana TaxID=516989 RepID=A0AAE0IJQ5_9PEZI|nr:Cerato-platanin [Apodospora peruviana]
MQFSKTLSVFSFISTALATTVSYDIQYNNSTGSLAVTACSDGPNGLMTRFKWKTYSDVPNFPYIGGVEAIEGWNSKNCSTCWAVTYGDRTIYILGIDHTARGLNINFEAMNDLTKDNALILGRIEANAQPAPGLHYCGL